MARGRALTAKDLKMIDELAEFVTESERNDELVRVMLKLMTVAKVPGAAAVLGKRRKELSRAKRTTGKDDINSNRLIGGAVSRGSDVS